jgi:hypothetical protein
MMEDFDGRCTGRVRGDMIASTVSRPRPDYVDDPNWGKTVKRELTGGVGVDHVVEIGGARVRALVRNPE